MAEHGTITELRNASTTRDAGLCLIAGYIASLVTMGLHPTAHDLFQPGQMNAVARLNTAVHSLALLAMPVLFLGALGLTLRVRGRLAISALVFYTFGLLTVANAAIMSGMVAVDAGRQVAATAASDVNHAWQVAFQYTGFLNQGFAKVSTVAISIAMLLWSAAILRAPRSLELSPVWRNIAIYGCALGPLTILLVLVGHLRLNVHGYGMIVLTEAIWFVVTGVAMWRERVSERQNANA